MLDLVSSKSFISILRDLMSCLNILNTMLITLPLIIISYHNHVTSCAISYVSILMWVLVALNIISLFFSNHYLLSVSQMPFSIDYSCHLPWWVDYLTLKYCNILQVHFRIQLQNNAHIIWELPYLILSSFLFL